MRLSLLFAIALASSLPMVSAQVATTPKGAVSGHVHCADSNAPCRFASVTIQSAPPAKNVTAVPTGLQSHSYAAATDIEGAFQIDGVAPGEYYILGRLSGYLSPYDLAYNEFKDDPSLAQDAFDVALDRITVAPGATATANLTLSRGASLGGTVRYDDGGVAINVAVQLFRKDSSGKWKPYTNSAGVSSLAPLGFAPHTDDRGRFYEPGLPPGLYVVEASLPEATVLPQTISGRQSLNVDVVSGNAMRVYDGDKYRLRDARPIDLHEGEVRGDIDIDIPTTGLRSIYGTVTAKSDGQSVTHGTVRLLDPDDKTTLRQTTLQEDGSFVFHYVVNGSYLVQIDALAANGNGKASVGYEPLMAQLLVEADVPSAAYSLLPAKH